MVQFGGDSREEVDQAAERMLDALHDTEHDPDVEFLDEPEREDELWQVREAGSAPPRTYRASRTRSRAGRTRRSGRSRSATTCGT